MKRKRFSAEQIVDVLKQTEASMPMAELIRHAGISEQTSYRSKKVYAGLQRDQAQQLKQPRMRTHNWKRLFPRLRQSTTHGDPISLPTSIIELVRFILPGIMGSRNMNGAAIIQVVHG
jgi:putative transposase